MTFLGVLVIWEILSPARLRHGGFSQWPARHIVSARTHYPLAAL